MSDLDSLADHQLRRATSRSQQPDAALDDDTTAEREAFLSLGSMLEAAGNSFDEGALIAKLQKSCLNDVRPTARSSSPASLYRDWSLIFAGGLAASALFVILYVGATVQRGDELAQVMHGQPGAPGVERVNLAGDSESPDDSASVASASNWNDPLDEQLAVAAVTISQLASGSRGFDGSLVDMNDRLEALSQELLSESL